ncbi:hypothetical protein F383_26891 [Gossypium arboreum]|uniref:Uncharacterized protein n=1 Tax=Gossypium arboreum TaxID=29729 RepID=A0A0B0P9S9_GOSAR|nr:hypothetical protein F383_26891 [Gossypium arboreum]
MSQTCLTLAQCLADACPRNVLRWLSSSRPRHVPNMSYTSDHNIADACPRHFLH